MLPILNIGFWGLIIKRVFNPRVSLSLKVHLLLLFSLSFLFFLSSLLLLSWSPPDDDGTSSANTSSSRSSPPSKSSLFGKFLLLTIASTLDSISIILCLQIFGMSLWDHKTHIMDALVGLIVSLVHNSTILPHTDYYLIKMRS